MTTAIYSVTPPNTFINVVAPDLDAVNVVIRQQLYSSVALVRQVSEYIINSGGKRIRPILVLLIAKAYAYRGTEHHILAAVIEFIHTATLLHDDVIDKSSMRRGKQTVHAIFGNAASVLVGDFLYSRAFQMMVAINQSRVMPIVANATNVIAEGEVLQLLNIKNLQVNEADYLRIIYSKTAKLFEAAAQLGALIANASEAGIKAAGDYGRFLGIAFQLIDDVLDYSGSIIDVGKNIGNDLREGKLTLPLIYLMKYGAPSQKKLVKTCIECGDMHDFNQILSAVTTSGALAYTQEKAIKAARSATNAIVSLRNSVYKDSLLKLATFAVQRKQ